MYFNFIHVQGVVTMQSWSVRFVHVAMQFWSAYTRMQSWSVYTRIQSWSVYTRIQSWSVYTRIQSWSVYTRIQFIQGCSPDQVYTRIQFIQGYSPDQFIQGYSPDQFIQGYSPDQFIQGYNYSLLWLWILFSFLFLFLLTLAVVSLSAWHMCFFCFRKESVLRKSTGRSWAEVKDINYVDISAGSNFSVSIWTHHSSLQVRYMSMSHLLPQCVGNRCLLTGF